MNFGILLMKRFLIGANDVLDDSYISAGLSPGREEGSVDAVGISIHDGHNTISLVYPLASRGHLTLLKEAASLLHKGINVMVTAAEAVCETKFPSLKPEASPSPEDEEEA